MCRKVVPLERSKPKIPIEGFLEASNPIEPFPFNKETDMAVGDALEDV